jgi:membrane protein implicated in regulation of membrane protease activity
MTTLRRLLLVFLLCLAGFGTAPAAYADIETAVEPAYGTQGPAQDMEGTELSASAPADAPSDAMPSFEKNSLPDEAAPAGSSEDGSVAPQAADAASAAAPFALSFSQPVLTESDGTLLYTTTLTVEDMDAFYGYQIRIEAPTEDSVSLKNLVGGTATEVTYRDGCVYQAVLLGTEGLSGDVAVCEISRSYAAGDTDAERSLTVVQMQVVTSVLAESMLTLGPDPAAATLSLPSDESALLLPLWAIISLAITVVALAILALIAWRKIRQRRPKHAARGGVQGIAQGGTRYAAQGVAQQGAGACAQTRVM